LVAVAVQAVITPPVVHAAWVRPGGAVFPDQAKGRLLGVDQFFWDANDPCPGHKDHLAGVLDDMRRALWKVGITRNMRNALWPDSETDPVKFGLQLSKDITRLGCDGKQCSAIADLETHDMGWVLAALKAFRAARSGRFLYWTLEPKQGGIIPSELAAWINNDPLTWVVVQKYRGGMQPVSERAVLDDLQFAGIRLDKILVYYERYEEGFEGILFDFANVAA
jgi:hypothetical protein